MAYIRVFLAPETLLDSPPLVMYLKPAKIIMMMEIIPIAQDSQSTTFLARVPTPVVAMLPPSLSARKDRLSQEVFFTLDYANCSAKEGVAWFVR